MNKMLRKVLCAALLAASAIGQDDAAALSRARVLEQQEGDLKAAEQAYRALLDGPAKKAVQDAAALRLGVMLWRLDRKDEAKTFLERAVAAGGESAAEAQAVLQGKGEASQQDAELAAKVKDALEQVFGTKLGDGAANLRWLGTAAIPTLIRELEARKVEFPRDMERVEPILGPQIFGPQALERLGGVTSSTGAVVQAVRRLSQAVQIAGFLWQIGGEEAQRYVRTAAGDPDVRWRRLLAGSAVSANDAMLPLVHEFLRDPDPEGIVPVAILRAMPGRLSVEAMLPLVEAPNRTVRMQAWEALGNPVTWNTHQEAAVRAMELLEPRLGKALADPDPEIARMAFRYLLGSVGTPRGTELLLEWLPRIPVFVNPGVHCKGPTMAAVVRAARALGPYATVDDKKDAREFLRQTAENALGSPDRTAAQMLDLVELGYERNSSNGFTSIAIQSATDPADLARAASLLDRCRDRRQAVEELGKRDLPAAALPPLQQRLLARLRAAPVQEPPEQGKSPKQLPPDQQEAATESMYLLQAIARTSSPEAASFLQQLCAQRPDYTITVAWASALPLAERCDSPTVSALLRELLVSPHVWQASTRDSLFAELVRRGDRYAVPLYTRAYELGLAVSARTETKGNTLRGARWLGFTNQAMSSADEQRAFSGYDAATAAMVWSTLFDGAALPEVMVDLASWNGEVPADVRALLLPVFLRRLPELLQTFVDPASPDAPEGPGRPNQTRGFTADMRATLRKVCEILARGTPDDDAPASQQYRAGITTLLANKDVGFTVALAVDDRAARHFLPQLKELLRTNSPTALARKLVKAGLPIEPADWLAMLGARSPWDREKALEMISPPVGDEVQRTVEARAASGEPDDVRVAACRALGRLLSPTSVASLLPLLRDPKQNVREAAADALQRIRLYHEQTAFWQNFQQGIDTSREAAASKLLLQSKPDQPKDQRLLAIRSLAVLGAPEALPYLIDWTKDADAEVAEAARAAVAQIHQAAGAGASRK